ncbi:hypothetical protein AVEN_238909-1 [Araneus ventricosus]|uniref:Uncharacterized protein n=1 Tax=Araneus ventricosus TaxID=182803 RepID=A0A4Y2WLF3_ARAVE|nr:hypothetical protein AVEN_238909-1 [Araneus ventricosus]
MYTRTTHENRHSANGLSSTQKTRPDKLGSYDQESLFFWRDEGRAYFIWCRQTGSLGMFSCVLFEQQFSLLSVIAHLLLTSRKSPTSGHAGDGRYGNRIFHSFWEVKKGLYFI